MWLPVSLLAFELLVQAELRVEIRGSEVWLIRGGSEAQLTHDLKAKPQALLSPSQNRIAYFEQCPEAEHCTPTIVVLDLQGDRTGSIQPQLQGGDSTEPCSSILSIAWNGDEAIAAECHINPSLSNYIETDIATGKTIRYLAGYDFTPSPDRKRVAHVGRIVHFAPPWAQSNYLQIDHTTIYPLPEGTGPTEQKGSELAPTVVRQQGLLFSGIHDFTPGFSWSPDSQRLALIDCTYDWTANHEGTLSAGDGVESNRHCSVAVVSLNGKAALFPMEDVPPADLWGAKLSWVTGRQVSLSSKKVTRTIDVP